MNVVMLGAPGAGKGTQAERLARHFGWAHIATGDLFRKHLSQGTELGQLAQGFMDRGALVPDDVTVAMVAERLSAADTAGGFILDGFPRTAPQALALEAMLPQMGRHLDRAIYLAVPAEVLEERLTGRRICGQCGATYHIVFHPPVVSGVCDRCGGALIQRADDRPDTVRRRLEVYSQDTAPLIQHYRQGGILQQIDGHRDVDRVTEDLVASLGNGG